MGQQIIHIGQKIKKIRELNNLTQSYMAKELDISQGAYSKIESGVTEISFSRLEKISKLLGVSIEEVLTFNNDLLFIKEKTNGIDLMNYDIYYSKNNKNNYENQISALIEEIATMKKILKKLLDKES